MYFIIRDDDLNYFSSPDDVKRWYSDVFAQEVPVGFASIPFVKGTSDVHKNSVEPIEFPIGKNLDLIAYVKSNPLIEILQHGCTHETVGGVYEYARTSGLIEETARGKKELESAFGVPMTVFVPPHDWIGQHGIDAIEKSHLNVIRGRGLGLRNWRPRLRDSLVFLKMLVYRFPRYISLAPRLYPHVVDFGTHQEAASYRLEDSDIFERLAEQLGTNSIFIVTAHIHGFTLETKQRLMQLIDMARKGRAEFVLPSEIFTRAS